MLVPIGHSAPEAELSTRIVLDKYPRQNHSQTVSSDKPEKGKGLTTKFFRDLAERPDSDVLRTGQGELCARAALSLPSGQVAVSWKPCRKAVRWGKRAR